MLKKILLIALALTFSLSGGISTATAAPLSAKAETIQADETTKSEEAKEEETTKCDDSKEKEETEGKCGEGKCEAGKCG